MQKSYSLLFRTLFLLLFCGASAFAQLPDFSLSVTNTNETCTGNACMTFTVSGTAAGASVAYGIYLLPNTTNPVATTSGSSYCGLTAGNYLVVATQSLNGNSNSQQQNVVVSSQIQNLTYGVDSESDQCGTSGTITVTTLTGTAVGYEIISGPQTAPLQTSNVFTGLQAGVYNIRVFDACGEGVVQTHTLFLTTPSLAFSANATSEVISCNVISVSQTINTNSAFAYPLTITYTTYPPNLPPQTNTTVLTTGGSNSIIVTQDLILYAGQTYSYDVTITDACGSTYTDTGNVIQENIEPILSQGDVSCDATSYVLFYATAGVITVAPDDYPFPLPHQLEANEAGAFLLSDLTFGTYIIMATDICGNVHMETLEVGPAQATDPIISIQKGCLEGYGSIYVRIFMGIDTIELISAPASYPEPLPQDLTSALDSTLALRLANLSAGTYVFHIVNTCGEEFNVEVVIDPLSFSSDLDIDQHCGSFDLTLNYADNTTAPITFWLQRFDPVSGNWEHPGTGNDYFPGVAPNGFTALSILNAFTNYNLAYTGLFRVVSYRSMFSVNESERHCMNALHEFEVLGIPVIDEVYSFSCNNETFDVVVEASGIPDLLYRITAINGIPLATPIDNGVSNIFTGLAPATYNFQVQDGCQNIANRVFDILEPYAFTISGSGACQGQPAIISVPYYGFLNYEWYQTDPGVILSTTGTLEIPEFSAADLGTYYVHIFTDNASSCIDVTLQYTLSEFSQIPDAGGDAAVSFCGPQGSIDLFGLIDGNYTTGGIWQEMTGSGSLSGSVWDSNASAPGTYVFNYTATGDCGPDDSSQISITLNQAPQNPVAFLEQDTCQGTNLQLMATFIAGATYQWNGPNGFASNQFSPVLTNVSSEQSGTYTVQAFIGSCASEVASIDVTIGSLPVFTVSGNCVNDRMMLALETTDTSFDMESAVFEWSGPNGFSATGNPIDATGQQPGTYNVNVTSGDGCNGFVQALVFGTLCKIPQGVSANDDGANDSWDLSGLGERIDVKIFNRYGMVVYEMDNYVNQWHGQSKNGNLLPSATYYYYIESEQGKRTGWVYLMRD